MRMSLRQKRLREQRSAFLFFLTFAFVYLVAGLPVAAGKLGPGAHAARHALLPGFAELDRNRDGYVDSSEAAAYPAYAGTFSWADADADGRLSAAEYGAALRRLERAP
jgi:hypothetical protein